MYSVLVVGNKGTGKTTYIKSLIDKIDMNDLFIFDPQGHYKNYFPYPFVGFKPFVDMANQLKNKTIVLEEATIFLNNRSTSESVRQLLVNSRHTNNTIIWVFHSLRAIPLEVWDLSNYVVLFKTIDTLSRIDKRFEHELLNKAYESVRKNPNMWYSETVDLFSLEHLK